MVTYLVGTDGLPASEAISDFLKPRVGANDHLEVANIQTSDDLDEIEAGKKAVELFNEQFRETVSVTTHQFNRGRSPTEELVDLADDVDADQIVTGLRRHSRAERIIFGSVSHALIRRTTRPVTLVPLK